MWTKHQLERDAIIIAEALEDHGQHVNRMLKEAICTRSPKAVTGVKLVFQDMYGYKMEINCKNATLKHTLRVLLGGIDPVKRTKDEKKDFQTDLRILFLAMKNGDLITMGAENETDGDETNKNSPGKETKLRSMWNEGGTNEIEKLIGDEYPHVFGTEFGGYQNVINILKTHRDPVTYFLTTLNLEFETKNEADLTRVLVTRAFETKIEADQMIENATSGCYKEFIKHVMANAVDMCYI
ncbi:hypothetical protein L1887_13822 [Cichorium endivia]|nr:hypothetical protein L1887_13822 [Cichorium endivia]